MQRARKLVAFEDDEARVSCSGRPVGVLFGDGRWHTVEGRLVEDPYWTTSLVKIF